MVEKSTKSSKVKKIIGVGLPILLLAGVIVGVTVISTGKTGVFELRKQAAVPEGAVSLSLGADATPYIGDVFPIPIMVDTGGKKLSSIAFRLMLPYNRTATPVLDVVDPNTGVPSNTIVSNTAGIGSGLVTSVNVVSRQITNGQIFIDFSATTVDLVGFSTTLGSPVLLATIWMKANGPLPGPLTITSDLGLSVAREKPGNLDVLASIASKTITLVKDTVAPVVEILTAANIGPFINSQAITIPWRVTDTPARTIADTKRSFQYQFRWKSGTTAWSVKQPMGTEFTATLTAPAHGAYAFEVKVYDNAGNIGSATRSFNVDLSPIVNSAIPPTGPAGTAVTITGSNFLAKGTKSQVLFGSTAATIVSWSDTQIVVSAPAVGGSIKVINASNLSKISTFVFGTETILRVIVPLQGISQNVGEKLATIVMKNGTSTWKFENVVGVWSSSDAAYMFTTLPISPAVIAGSKYTVSIKENTRLKRKFTAVTIKPNIVNVVSKKTTADMLLSGDILGQNNITVSDFSFCMSELTESDQSATTDNQKKCDVNGDGKLTILDVSLVLSNYKALENKGSDE